MKKAWLAWIFCCLVLPLWSEPAAGPAAKPVLASGPVFEIDFSRPGSSLPHWTLTLRPDGSGHFRSELNRSPTGAEARKPARLDAPDQNREIQLSAAFAQSVFRTALRKNFFQVDCDSHLAVAFQGWKKLSYRAPDGQGSCTYNFSQDKEIRELGEALLEVAETIFSGARLELMLQHDRLGLDAETAYLAEGVQNGQLRQIGAIRGTLERVSQDPAVLQRVRKRAGELLAGAEK